MQAYIRGYSERLIDFQALAVQAGYWGAYYNNNANAKPIGTIIDIIRGNSKGKTLAPDVPKEDIERFEKLEAMMKSQKGGE